MFEDKKTIEELRIRLIDYITTFEPNAKDIKEVPELDYYSLLKRYKKALGESERGTLFEQILKEYVDNYRMENPDSELSDNEIYFALDVLNPCNFISIIENKLQYFLKKYDESKEKNDQITFTEMDAIPEEDLEDDIDLEATNYDNRKSISIYRNTIKKCRNMLKIIEEKYMPGRTR